MSTIYTTATQAAAELGCAKSTITRTCAKHSLGTQPGRDLLLTAAEMKKLRALVRPGQKGNPNFVLGNTIWQQRKAEKKKRKTLQ